MSQGQKQQLAEKSFVEILKDGFRLFIKTYLVIILPMMFFYICYIVLRALILTDLIWHGFILRERADYVINQYAKNPNSVSEQEYDIVVQSYLFQTLIGFLDLLILAVLTVIALCSVSSFLYKTYLNKNPNFKEEFKNSFNKSLFKVVLLIGLGFSLGWNIFWIPGIIIGVLFIFFVYTYNMENIKRPVREARLISGAGNHSYLKVLGIFAISFLIINTINFIYTLILVTVRPVNSATLISWYNPATRNYGMIILYELTNNLITILFTPLLVCLLTPLFVSLKAQKEIEN
ncbi:MAG: hypothetical protein ACFFAO_11090, partial [Candidatus Hermodarchaeota archaeon]